MELRTNPVGKPGNQFPPGLCRLEPVLVALLGKWVLLRKIGVDQCCYTGTGAGSRPPFQGPLKFHRWKENSGLRKVIALLTVNIPGLGLIHEKAGLSVFWILNFEPPDRLVHRDHCILQVVFPNNGPQKWDMWYWFAGCCDFLAKPGRHRLPDLPLALPGFRGVQRPNLLIRHQLEPAGLAGNNRRGSLALSRPGLQPVHPAA